MTVETVRFRGWEVRCDPAETRRIYLAIAERMAAHGGAACPCVHCLNFYCARDHGQVFPKEVISVFESLGIDYRYESELLTQDKYANGAIVYAAWFPFVADRLDHPSHIYSPASRRRGGSWGTDYAHRIDDSCSVDFTDRVLFVPDLFGRRPVLEAIVRLKVPWVLDEPDSEEPLSHRLGHRLE